MVEQSKQLVLVNTLNCVSVSVFVSAMLLLHGLCCCCCWNVEDKLSERL